MTDKFTSPALAVEDDADHADLITLSTGVVLTATPVSSMIFTEVQKRNKMPRPPVWHNPENDRDEENPLHPAYVAAKADWEMLMSTTMIDVMVLRGTSIKEIPKGFPKLEDMGWSDDMELSGLSIPKDGRARYLAYVKFVACATPDDLQKVLSGVSRLSGVAEEDVAAAAEQFRDKN